MAREGERYIVAGVCQMLLRMASFAGVDRATLLARAGLAEMDIADSDARVDLSVHVRLGNAILARIPDVNPALGIALAVVPTTLGVVGHVIANCPTLHASLLAFSRYQRLISNALDVAILSEPGGVRFALQMAPELAALRLPVEAAFVLWLTITRQLTGVAWKPLRLELMHAPVGDPSAYERFFGVKVAFEATANAMLIARETLPLPIVQSRPDRHGTFTAHLESMLAEEGEGGRITGRVQARVAIGLQSGPVNQAEVAAALGMSQRTLSRRLKAENTTFGDLVERVRRDLAIRYLRHSDCAVYEIAFLLGYSEPSAFHRTFRRWTGQTPSEFRRAGVSG